MAALLDRHFGPHLFVMSGMEVSPGRVLLIGTHVALAVVLVAMAVPQVPRIPEQFASGYVPDYYPLHIALTVAPFVVAATLIALLAFWLRRSIRWPLVFCDLATWALAWSVFLVYLLGTDLALVQFGIAPVCFVVAALVAVFERSQAGPNHVHNA